MHAKALFILQVVHLALVAEGVAVAPLEHPHLILPVVVEREMMMV